MPKETPQDDCSVLLSAVVTDNAKGLQPAYVLLPLFLLLEEEEEVNI